ncbi:thioredoxin-disulfide reductase [Candidatus Dojkabacteria bacterium]|uniref:Thioredoxin reductase n=1 Tax=Candidatus Dojkabacteria bacterium TaxID=2099670 RepID=A0A955RI72_9BACT|nr:thioredoxin-disulfide reductase [Candidatus Dojkabacteria bacterium]
MENQKLVIIGSGPAGLTAAIYAARASLNPLVLGGLEFGGQLMGTSTVENFPGFIDGILGPELMQNMISQAERFGAKMEFRNVDRVDFSGETKRLWAGDDAINAEAVIIATGSSPRKLGIESEQKFWGKGVSSCATCDGAFYKEKIVAVIGGGDSAAEEATFLTKFAKKVYLIHRRDELRASKFMQEKVFNNEKIELVWDSEVIEVLGDLTVSGIKVRNTKTNNESELELNGVFLAIGHVPNTKIFEGQIELDDKGYIVVTDETKTSVDGIFVAGDVKDYRYQQAITASGMGCMAAMDTEKWLEMRK